MKAVDLHTHSNKSDGSLTPAMLVQRAISKGLAAIALTDHDTTAGLAEARRAAEGSTLEVIPGVEISTEYQKQDIHIVGLYIDETKPAFTQKLQEFVNARDIRNEKMCNLLHDKAGFDISYKKLLDTYPGSVITRAHYARYLCDHGFAKSKEEVFEKYIGDGKPYFIPREKITPQDGIALIRLAGGIPILAHPILYHFSDAVLRELIASLKDAGLVGIEAIYSTYTQADERKIRNLAKQFSLCISGGSDFHGAAKPDIDVGTGRGHLFVPETVLDELKTNYSRG